MSVQHPHRRHSTGRVAAIALLALVAAACGGGESAETDDSVAATTATTGSTGSTEDTVDPGAGTTTTTEAAATAKQGGSIIIGLEAETNSWLPGQANFGNPGINVALAIYDPLMRRDETGAMRPFLAESLEANADLTEWTLQLREGVVFHDGTPLDAAAVKTIFDEFINIDASNLAGQVKDVASVEVADALTVVYRLNQPNAAFGDILAGAVGWPFSPTAAKAAGADAGSQPVGTGPFVFDSWQRDDRLILKRNEQYWQAGLPYLDEIIFRPVPDEDTRISSLAAGDIDVLQSLRQSTIRRAREVSGVESFEHLGNNSGSAIFNTSRPPLDDVRVRQALAYALNQDDLVEILGGTGLTPPHSQYFSPDSPWFSTAAEQAWPTNDQEAASALVDEYTSDPQRSDGKAAGDPIAFQFDCPPDPSLIELAQMYQAQWAEIGIEVNLNQVEQATHVSQALAGEFDAKCWRVSSQDDPYRIFSDAFGEGSPLNFTRFNHPDIDRQLDVLRSETDLEPRVQAVEEISLVLAEHVPNTFTAGTLTALVARSEVRNIDGWVFPDGTPGEGVPGATTMWGHVWLDS